ncbi:MAG TPA: FkbM family methyltransferase [Isosphaeraceae bacterium]|nr:FkbM family methyltransferase [Isosphaeraceae bacterium]
MMNALKHVGWYLLAQALSTGAALIRRQPAGSGPNAWRAVEFSYAHFGEDLIVLRLLRDIPTDRRGIYVDVGAFDPVRHSNTYILYVHGWRGLNIDANPVRLAAFGPARPGEITVLAAVSDAEHDVLFLEYPTPGTNRVVAPDTLSLANALGEQPVSVTPRRTETLTQLLGRHAPGADRIDFLNIDCEGQDLAVLQGLDWSRWLPRVIAVEANTPNDRRALIGFLEARGYRLVSQHLVTLIFLHASAGETLPIGMWPRENNES